MRPLRFVVCSSAVEENTGVAARETAAASEATCRIIERLEIRVISMGKSKRKSGIQRANESHRCGFSFQSDSG
jgi:hypothetical protein